MAHVSVNGFTFNNFPSGINKVFLITCTSQIILSLIIKDIFLRSVWVVAVLTQMLETKPETCPGTGLSYKALIHPLMLALHGYLFNFFAFSPFPLGT